LHRLAQAVQTRALDQEVLEIWAASLQAEFAITALSCPIWKDLDIAIFHDGHQYLRNRTCPLKETVEAGLSQVRRVAAPLTSSSDDDHE
jgi:hypothetical protein